MSQYLESSVDEALEDLDPCFFCSDPVPSSHVCSNCDEPCCKAHSVSMEGIFLCHECEAEIKNEEEED